MHILVATDADYVLNEVVAALGASDVSFTVVSDGRAVVQAAKARTPDLVVLDLQVGSMGGMATAMALRLDASAGLVQPVRILMLLDRAADIHLAKRSGADGYLVKPLSPLALKRVAREILNPPAAAAAPETAEELAPAAG